MNRMPGIRPAPADGCVRGFASACAVRTGFGILLAFWVLLSWAQMAVPDLAGRVIDLTGTLSIEQSQALDGKLAAFEAQTGSQIAVLIVPTTQPEDIAQFGIRVADAWKVGREKIDDGVILIVAKQDRRARIEVGYGLEGAIPDAVGRRILAETLTPHFQTGDYAGGIDASVTQMMKLIQGEALPAPDASGELDGDLFSLLVVGGVVAGFVLSMIMNRPMAAGIAALGSGAVGAWWIGLTPVLLFAVLFVFGAVAGGFRGRGGNWSSGGGGFGRGGGGSWGGGGGGFGGGGASGSW